MLTERSKAKKTYHGVSNSEQHFSKTLAFKYAHPDNSVIAMLRVYFVYLVFIASVTMVPGSLIWCNHGARHSRPQRPRSGLVQHRKSAIHGLPVTLRLLRVKSDKSDWFWSQSIVFSKPFQTRTSLDLARGRDYWC